MTRLTSVLILLVGALAGALGFALFSSDRPLDEGRVRAIAEEAIAAAPRTEADRSAIETMVAEVVSRQPRQDRPAEIGAIDPATLNPLIEDYLLKNPRILQRVSAALDAELTAARKAASSAALAELKPDIYDDPGHIVLGNPNGDVTLVEMFDYNCGYCRQALPDLAQLLDEDPNLRIILKEFPILSPGSLDAARVAIQVAEAKVDYWNFHQALFTSRGQVDKAVALKAAADLGLNPITLEMGMNTPKVTEVLQTSYRIADKLGITGTPAFIIGDEVVPGAVGVEQLRMRIANMRACGSTTCPPAGQPG